MNTPEEVINKARNMRALFLASRNYGTLPVAINTEAFEKTVAKETGYTIESAIVPMDEHLRGMLIRKNKHARILISDQNNFCWKRFTFVKELSHLFLDNPSDFTANAEELARCFGDRELGGNGLYECETRGIIAAVEIMIPEEFKTRILHDFNVQKKTPYAIAHELRVPQKYIEWRIQQWTA